jgi:hypothetical protein
MNQTHDEDEDDASYKASSPTATQTQTQMQNNVPMIGPREMQLLVPVQKFWKPIKLPVSPEKVEQAKKLVRKPHFDYNKLFKEYGYLAVVDAAHKEAMDVGHPFMKDTANRRLSTLEVWRTHGLPLLASSPEFLLRAFYGSGIQYDLHLKKPEISKLFQVDGTDATKHSDWMVRAGMPWAPSIYVQEFVDDYGDSPCPDQLRKIIVVLRGYVSGVENLHEQNAAIDSLSREHSEVRDIEQGYHSFLRGREDRVVTLLTFCFALEGHLDELNPEFHDLPLNEPLRYVGFSVSTKDRFDSYKNGRDQSWLSELFSIACSVALPRNKFKLRSHVICFLTNLQECQIGEELFSTSGMAYANTGRGFGLTPAGLSVNGANLSTMKAGEAEKLWENTRKFRNRDYFERNMAAEGDRFPLYKEYVAKLRAEAKAEGKGARVLTPEQAEIVRLRKEIKEIKDTTIPLRTVQREYNELKKVQKAVADATAADPDLHAALVAHHKRVRATIHARYEKLESYDDP